jgi:EAL domain-containing protein (putative c-di-GMP-specific phosphodiesterase class I)
MEPKPRNDPFHLLKASLPPATRSLPNHVENNARQRFAVAQAIAQDRLVFRFQPVACASSPRFAAFHELIALLRLPDGQMVPTAAYGSIIGETEIGREVDRLSLRCALRLLSETPGLRLSVNLTTAAMGDDEWLGLLSGAHETGSSACGRLILEIGEDVAVREADLVNDFAGYVRTLGPAFALDNFGAGATGFSHFRAFRFDMVKIDPGFCRGIHASRDSQVLVQCLQRLSMQFDMLCIADGVDSEADAVWLCDAGIDCMQGAFYGRPSARPEPPAHCKADRSTG